MKKSLLLSLLLALFFSCSEHEDKNASIEFNEQIRVIREVAKTHADLVINAVKKQGKSSFYSKETLTQEYISSIDPNEPVKPINSSYWIENSNIGSIDAIKEKLTPQVRPHFESVLKIFSAENLSKQIAINGNSGGRTTDTFESIVEYGQQQLAILDGYILDDPGLTNEEKVQLIGQTAVISNLLPSLGGLAEVPCSECFQTPTRVASWDWLKKTVNVIATIVAHVIQGVFSQVTAIVAISFTYYYGFNTGWIIGASLGGLLGLAEGLNCLIQATSTNYGCYTCVFYVDDPNAPCH